jgi:phosphoserine phosphatase
MDNTEKKPIVAIMYDFDKTLCTKDMQEYTFIPSIKMESGEFWAQATEKATQEKMDRILAYMYLMLKNAKAKDVSIRRNAFKESGMNIEYYDGVKEWFARIRQFGEENGVRVRHYIISSGLKEIIEGSEIFDEFDEIYACEFLYDVDGIAVWPKQVVNYTTKTQYLFRINKGIYDISDDDSLNEYVREDSRPIPFRNMIYIGDGLTDVPCMKLVKVNGGYSIAVYTDEEKVRSLMTDDRVNYIARADYRPGTELDELVKNIIVKMSATDRLVKKHMEQMDSVRSRENEDR